MPAPQPPEPGYTPKYHPAAATAQPIRHAVGIKLLVYFDGFTGLTNLAFGAMACQAELPMVGSVAIGIGGAVLLMGALLFTRTLWSYWLALIGHAVLLALRILLFAMSFLIQINRPGPNEIVGGLLGIVLLALCTQRAWHLIRQVRDEQAAQRNRAAVEAAAAPPGHRPWDDAPIE